MIAIDIGGEFLELGAARIRLRITSQFFTRSIASPAFTFPVSLPHTPKNARLLGHANSIDRHASVHSINCNIWLGGLQWKPAKLNYRGYVNNVFDVDFTVQPDGIVEQLNTTYLGDLEYGNSEDYEIGGVFSYKSTNPYPLDPAELNALLERSGPMEVTPYICAPLWNEDTDVPSNYLNLVQPAVTNPWYTAMHFSGLFMNLYGFVPMPYMVWVTQRMMDRLNVPIKCALFDDPEIRSMVIIGNTLHTLYYGDINPAYEVVDTMRLADVLPKMTCAAYLTALMQRFNAGIVFRGGVAELITMNEVLDSGNVLDITSLVVPLMDFDQDAQQGFNFSMVQDPKDTSDAGDFEYGAETVLGYVATPADLDPASPPSVRNEVRGVRADSALYKYATDSWADTSGEWERVATDPFKIFPLGEYNVKLGTGRTAMGLISTDFDTYLLPRIKQRFSGSGTNVYGYTDDDKCTTLRLLFNRGVRDGQLLVSPSVWDKNGDELLNEEDEKYVRLEHIGDDPQLTPEQHGIVNHHYRRWLPIFENKRTRRAQVRLSIDDIMDFDFTRKVQDRGTSYLVEYVDIEFSTRGMGLAMMNLVRIAPPDISAPVFCAGGLRVSGSGIPEMDGIYCPDGTENDGPVWTKVGGVRLANSIYQPSFEGEPLSYLVMTNGAAFEVDPTLSPYYTPSSVDPLGGWGQYLAFGTEGPLPAPTVVAV